MLTDLINSEFFCANSLQISERFGEALERANNFFLFDRFGQMGILPFFTNIVNPISGETTTCLVRHHAECKFEAILPQDTCMPTHLVKTTEMGAPQEARIVGVVDGGHLVDLFDLRSFQGTSLLLILLSLCKVDLQSNYSHNRRL